MSLPSHTIRPALFVASVGGVALGIGLLLSPWKSLSLGNFFDRKKLQLASSKGNCEIQPLKGTIEKLPEDFNLTEQNYFSVLCENQQENILTDYWVGFFPKSLFGINRGNKFTSSAFGIKIEDLPDEHPIYKQAENNENTIYGIKISSPNLINNESIDAKLTYKKDTYWAEIEPVTKKEQKIYLLLFWGDSGGEARRRKK